MFNSLHSNKMFIKGTITTVHVKNNFVQYIKFTSSLKNVYTLVKYLTKYPLLLTILEQCVFA